MAEPVVTQNDGSAAQAGGDGAATPQTPATGTGTAGTVTLESRIAGLEARLTEQGRSKSAAEKERDEARDRLAAYEAGKLGENEAFQAELKRTRERAEAAERTAAVARIEAKYPETFGVFGEAVAGMSEEALAANEARLAGVAAAGEPPTPRTPGTQRPAAPKPGEARPGEPKKTFAQLAAEFRTVRLPWQEDAP